jgi:hypothetical protein
MRNGDRRRRAGHSENGMDYVGAFYDADFEGNRASRQHCVITLMTGETP